MMNQLSDNTFAYRGYHFTPFRKFHVRDGDFFEITKRLVSDREMGLCTYEWQKKSYSHKSFYKASPDKKCDIFLCVENGKLYVPCENELFLFR